MSQLPAGRTHRPGRAAFGARRQSAAPAALFLGSQHDAALVSQAALRERSRDAQGRVPTGRESAHAFTLTDLLVTLAVLSLLGVIAAGRLVAARDNARLSQCIANLQKVDRAVLDFAAENNQTLPAPVPGDNRFPWWFYKEQVKRYAGLAGESSANDAVFACPSDRGYSDPAPFHLSQRFDFSSYVFNGVTLAGSPNIGGWPLARVQHPQRTLLVMEWTAHAPLSWHKSRTGNRNSPFYCDARSVVAFVDGRVSLEKIYYDGFNAAYTQDPIDGYAYQYSGN
jgi:type II secretory pathway pseudopilin PulG